MNKFKVESETLQKLYFDKQMTFREISTFLGLSLTKVIYDFKKCGFTARARGCVKGAYKHTEETKQLISKIKGKKCAGHKKKHQEGYVLIYFPDHPNSIAGYVYEHRLLMEKALGRYLEPLEIVHHINGIRTDNRIENLQLFENASEHQRYHALNTRKRKGRYLA